MAVAILLPTYVMPRLTRIPISVRAEAVSLADNASVLDTKAVLAGWMRTETGVPVKVQTLVKSASPSDRDRVTLVESTRVLRTDRQGSTALVTARAEAMTVSRTSSEPVDPPAQIALDYGKPADTVPHKGFELHFPFGTQRHSYLYFDTTARRDIPLDYIDDDRVESGLRLYHFRQRIGPLNLHADQPDMAATMPASAWGLPGDAPTTFDLYYSNTRDIWVEPDSGVIVEQREHLRRFLARQVDDPLAVTSLELSTHFDDQSLADSINTAKQARTLIRWGHLYGPVLLAVVGALAVLAGSGLLLRRAKVGRDH
ncbi:hypothetical protein AWN90_06840 [Nocardia terpenica]|uniref:DUF3068 domain-containing protein n=1 Tax=Nocardia terpenica TaxID=455432 RepID=A0A164JC11_9NOCA|nr:hypothetical protein AWN90_06840 [Nocardia terpenica]